jgi:hypothetical protein
VEIYYDSEFLENGITIEPISIGMVRQDDTEYYGIFNNMNTIIKTARDPWLKENVLSSLPLVHPIDPAYPVWDETHPDFIHVKSKTRIALDVANLIRSTYDPSLWAWFCAYDHVLLAQMYGKMTHLPPGIPMRTNDLCTEAERLGNIRVPNMPGITHHNALSDAREVKFRREWLKEYEQSGKCIRRW